jgi:hypothetical protein
MHRSYRRSMTSRMKSIASAISIPFSSADAFGQSCGIASSGGPVAGWSRLPCCNLPILRAAGSG